jgi:outer membrane receptor protein involved in Fe transport
MPRHPRRWPYVLLLPAIAVPFAAAQEPPATELEPVTVIGVTPVDGRGLPADMIPGNIQRASGEEVEQRGSLDLAEFMSRNFGSVFVNEAQNNPLQPDVQFRGFVASPLLGLPQGVSLFQDGVRINEPFGDTVNWALVPSQAIASIELMPGSNPLFGLNTLGGALSINTKNGFTHAGTRAEVLSGSFGRLRGQFESGGRFGRNGGYYLAGGYLEEDGWRDYSPSEATQLFGNFGWHGTGGSLDLSVTSVDTDLIGNGAAPAQLLAADREAIFTRPDRTENELTMLNLSGSRELAPGVTLEGLAYFRGSDIGTFNGDDSDYEECEDVPGLVCEEEDDEEEIVLDGNGDPIPFSEDLEGATVNRSRTEQDGYGAALQARYTTDFAGRENHLIIGGSVDEASVDFSASTELGALDATRQAIGAGVFVGDAFTALETDTRSYGLFITDTLSVTERLGLTLSGRYNYSEVELRDQLGTALNGDHRFERFNPAAGLTWRLSPAVQLYASYSESNRAPSPVELTCADEDDPCRLPNAFLADPPLEQVVAHSIEAGARGQLGAMRWHAGAFQTDNEDDILFISAGALTSEGFFDNVGETRRRGVEINLTGTVLDNRLNWFFNYTWLDATFEESFNVASPNNPEQVGGEIPVSAGDRLPGIPDHLMKLGASFDITRGLLIGGDLLYSSDRVFRGDEGNLVDPVPGYAIANLWGEYRITPRIAVFAKVDNLFDRDYETFGLFGEPDEVLGDAYDDPRFLSPGAPRSAWIGARVEL